MNTQEINQMRRYSVRVDVLAQRLKKSKQTIYHWQRSNPDFLDAVSQHARNDLWDPLRRQKVARQYVEDGLSLILDPSQKPGMWPYMTTLTQFIFYLSGVDLWLLMAACQKTFPSQNDNAPSSLEDQILSDAVLQQILFLHGDMDTISGINNDLTDSMAMAELSPQLDSRLTCMAVAYINGERQAREALLSPRSKKGSGDTD